MKRELFLFGLVFSVLVINSSFISAYSFGDFFGDVRDFASAFRGEVTGNQIYSGETTTVTVSEGSRAGLSCYSGKIRSVDSTYWCPDGSGREMSCGGGDAVGLSSVYVTFTNSNCGGDPCEHVAKKGDLTVSCGEVVCSDYVVESGCLLDGRCDWITSGNPYCQNKPAVVVSNSAPVITSNAWTQVNESSSYSYWILASDANGDSLTYSLAQGPSWLSVSSSGLVSGTSPSVSADTSYFVSVRVSDGKDSVTQSYYLTVKNVVVNSAPVITSSAVTSVDEGEDYSYSVGVYDSDSDAISYLLMQGPYWVSVSSSGLVSGMAPNVSSDSSWKIIVRATDSKGAFAEQGYYLMVKDVPEAAAKTVGSVALTGCVEDSFGDRLLSANVKVSGTSLGGTTGSDGCFVVSGVSSGIDYQVEISYIGFQTKTVSIQEGDNPLIRLESETLIEEEVVVEDSAPPHPILRAEYSEDTFCTSYGNSVLSSCPGDSIEVHNGDSVEFISESTYEGFPVNGEEVNWYRIYGELDVSSLESLIRGQADSLGLEEFFSRFRVEGRRGVNVNVLESVDVLIGVDRVKVKFSVPIGLIDSEKQYVVLEVSDFERNDYEYYIQEVSVGCFDGLRSCESDPVASSFVDAGVESVALTSEQKIKMTFEACKSDQDCREFGAVCSLGFCSPREFEGLSCKLSSGRGATVFYEGKNVNNPFYMNPKFKQKGSASPVQESSCVSGDSSKIRVPICSESGVSFEVRDCEEGMGCVDGECSSLSFNFNLINEEIFEIRDIMATKNRVQRSSSGNVIYEYFIAHGGSFSIEKGQDYTAIFFEGTLLSGQAPIQYRFESSGEHTHIYRSVILQEQSDSEEHYIFSIDERISSTSRVDSSDLIHFSKRGSEEEKALENFISQLEDIKKNVLDYAVTGEEDYLFTASSNCVVDLNLVFDGATSYHVAGNDLIVELDGNLLSFYGDFDDEIAVFGCDDEGCSGGKAFITSDSGGITGNVVRANQDSNAVVKCTQSQRDLYLELANAENPFVEFRSLTFSGRGQIVDGKVGSDLMRLTNKGDIVRSVDLYIPAGLDTKNSYATSTGDRIESITISSSKTSNILGKSGEEAEYIVLKTVEDYYVDTAKGVSEIKKGIYLVPLDYKDIVSKAGLEKSRSLKELLERYDSNSGTRNGIIFLNSEDGSKFEIPSERGITFSNNGLNYAFVSLASNPEFEAGDYAVPVKRKESLGGSSRGPWSYDFGRMRDIQEAFRPGFIEEWYNAGKNFLTNDLFGVLDRSR